MSAAPKHSSAAAPAAQAVVPQPTAPAAHATPSMPASRPRPGSTRSWRVMNLVSRSRWLRDAVCTMVQARARAAGYRWDQELARGGSQPALAPLDPATGAGRLAQDGICLGLQLAPDVVESLLSFALLGTCYGDSDPGCGFAYVDRGRAEAASGRSFSLATYLFTDEVDGVIARVANDPTLRAVIARYFGAPPVYLGRRIWWTLRTPEHLYDHRLTTCHYHYDRDDYRSVRVFFHLTAVDAHHGQHIVIRSSHRRKSLLQQVGLRARSDANIERYYGPGPVTAIEGAAGSGFIEDTYCYHKATRPVAGDRLMLELGFGLRNHRRFPPPDRASARLIDLPGSR